MTSTIRIRKTQRFSSGDMVAPPGFVVGLHLGAPDHFSVIGVRHQLIMQAVKR